MSIRRKVGPARTVTPPSKKGDPPSSQANVGNVGLPRVAQVGE